MRGYIELWVPKKSCVGVVVDREGNTIQREARAVGSAGRGLFAPAQTRLAREQGCPDNKREKERASGNSLALSLARWNWPRTPLFSRKALAGTKSGGPKAPAVNAGPTLADTQFSFD